MNNTLIEQRKQKARERTRKWRNKHHARCQVCGRFIHPYAQHCQEHTNRFKREHNPNWRGGRMMKGGYVLIQKPEHPRANTRGYVREHIIIWEETYGKSLPPNWHIHHLNGIKSDNRHCNLIALPSQAHHLVLQAKAKRIQELEALLNHQNQLL